MSFRFREVEHQLEIVDRGWTTFRSEHKFWLEAKQPTRFFVRDFFWTGSGAEKEPVPELVSEVDVWGFPHHRVHGPMLVEGESRVLVVDLGRTIGKGEVEVVHFRHRMKDLGGTFNPVLASLPATEIIKRLAIRLILPRGAPQKVMYYSVTHDTNKVVDSREVAAVTLEDGRLLFERIVLNPKKKNLGHKLQWEHHER